MVFQKLTSQIALAFLSDYPTPQAAALLGEGRMRQFCRRHSYRGGKSPADLVSRLRATPASANPIAPRILESIVHGAVVQIRPLNTRSPVWNATSQMRSRPTQRRRCCRRFHALPPSAWQR